MGVTDVRQSSDKQPPSGSQLIVGGRPMTLHLQAVGPVPEETARVARAACPKGNPYLAMRDLLGSLYEDRQFVTLFPPQGQPALAPWRLAPGTIMQFAQGLS